MFTVGIDAHYGVYAMCILDQNGKVVKERTIRGGPGDVAGALGALGGPSRVCFEASCGYGVLYDRIAPRAERVVVAHPKALRLIFRSTRKNDRVDAHKLATLLYLDQVPAVHVPDARARAWRELVEHRRALVDKRTRAQNGLRAILRTLAVPAKRGRGLWTRAGRAWLGALPMPDPMAELKRDQLLLEVEHYNQLIRLATRRLDAIGAAHPGVWLLRSIPGVGPRTAEAVMAYVDEPRRFARSKQACAYFGLVPCQDESAGKARFGHITREGPATVRKLLTEAAWQGIRRSPRLRAFFERVKGGKKERRKLALVATARHLAKVMLAMLRTGEVWRPEEGVRGKARHAAPGARKEVGMTVAA